MAPAEHVNKGASVSDLFGRTAVTRPPPRFTTPKTEAEVAAERTQLGFVRGHEAVLTKFRTQDGPLVSDGVFYKGAVPDAEDQTHILRSLINALHRVGDKHFPEFSVVACGFIRQAWVELDPAIKGAKATLWFSFTSPYCPAGNEMMEAAKSLVDTELRNLGLSRVEVDCRLGGSPWTPDSGHGAAKEFFKATIAKTTGGANGLAQIAIPVRS